MERYEKERERARFAKALIHHLKAAWVIAKNKYIYY